MKINTAVQTLPYQKWVNLLQIFSARIDLKFEEIFKNALWKFCNE